MLLLVAVPIALSLIFGRNFINEARLEHSRSELERRAAGGARRRRSWRRAAGPSGWRPRTCPTSPGFEVGRVYQAGSG